MLGANLYTGDSGGDGNAQRPPGDVSIIEETIYTVSPASVPVAAGMVVGELTGLKITERVEQGSGRVASLAKLSGSLKLRNTSRDQTVRLVGATVRFIDSEGNVINLEDARTQSIIRFGTSKTNRLDPGHNPPMSYWSTFPPRRWRRQAEGHSPGADLSAVSIQAGNGHLAVSIGSP